LRSNFFSAGGAYRLARKEVRAAGGPQYEVCEEDFVDRAFRFSE
jgi:hypothetical protein